MIVFRWCIASQVFVLWIKPHTAQRTNRGQHVAPEPKTWLSFFNPSSPPFFSILTHFLFLLLSLYSSLALPSKSKSCVTIATAAVCENYLNPSLFFHCVFPVTFNGYCFDVGTHNRSRGVLRGGGKNKKRRVERWMLRGTTEQSSRAERGEEGLEVEKPGGQTYSQSAGDKVREKTKKTRVRRKANTDRDGRRKTARQTIMQTHKKQKTNKQRVNKERQAKGTPTASRQIE